MEKKRTVHTDISGAYVTYAPSAPIVGFIAHIHDALNVDMALYLPPEIERRYDVEGVYTSKCILVDTPAEGVERLPGVESVEVPTCQTLYRCHIRGIGKKRSKGDSKTQYHQRQLLAKRAHFQLIRRTNISGGWVTVTVSDIDTYGRILVTMHDIITGENLCDIIHNQPVYKSIYEKYKVVHRGKYPSL